MREPLTNKNLNADLYVFSSMYIKYNEPDVHWPGNCSPGSISDQLDSDREAKSFVKPSHIKVNSEHFPRAVQFKRK